MAITKFLKNNLGFEWECPRQFVVSQCLPNQVYLVWATFWAIWNVTFLALDPYFLHLRGKLPDNLWFVFLTHWGYIILTISILINVFTAYHVQCRRSDIMEGAVTSMPWYLRLNWLFYSMATSTALAITILYFGFLGLELTINSVNFHIVNSVYVILNLLVVAKPMKILHMVYPMAFAIVYVSFSAIHQSATGIVIYAALDWTKIEKTLPLSLILIFVGVPILHLTSCGLTLLREKVCCNKSQKDDVV